MLSVALNSGICHLPHPEKVFGNTSRLKVWRESEAAALLLIR